MIERKLRKPAALALGTALIGSAALVGTVHAADANPFVATALSAGYSVGEDAEGTCGEGTCSAEGEDKGGEGSCGEEKGGEGSCGEGNCGG